MLRFTDSFAYTDWARAATKYLWAYRPSGPEFYQAGSNFWNLSAPNGGPGWASGTNSGYVDVGPYPGTASLHMQSADPMWYRSAYMGPSPGFDWFVGMW